MQQQRQKNAFRNFRETEFSFSESPKVAVIDSFTSICFEKLPIASKEAPVTEWSCYLKGNPPRMFFPVSDRIPKLVFILKILHYRKCQTNFFIPENVF